MATRPRPAPAPSKAKDAPHRFDMNTEAPDDGPTVPIESLPEPEVKSTTGTLRIEVRPESPGEASPDVSVAPETPEGTSTAPDQGKATETFDIVRALWYGDPGVGKTTSMLTAANLGPVVVWDAENRLKATALRRAGINTGNIERLVDVSYEAIKSKLDQMVEDPPFAVCFDGVTEMLRVMVAHLVDVGVAAAAKKGYERSEWTTHLEDYGNANEQFRRLTRMAMRLPCHFGMTTLSQRVEDENKRQRVAPQLTPAVLRDVNAAMDIITFVRMDEVGDDLLRSGLIQPGSQYDAKDTFGVLPRRLANPTFERIIAYVNEELDRETDPDQESARQALADAAAKVK